MSDAFFFTTALGYKKGMEALKESHETCEKHRSAGHCKSCNPHRISHASSCFVRLFKIRDDN